jgi:hypothetical protein
LRPSREVLLPLPVRLSNSLQGGQRRRHCASLRQRLSYAVPTMDDAACIDAVGGHGARESFICIEGPANAHSPSKTGVRRPYGPPYGAVHYVESKENRPLFAALGQGVALILFFRLPRNRGGRRATRRMTQVALDRSGSAWLPDGPGSPGPGREASRPAPCGAPTRHLGLYAFDRGRTGPAPSGRRGCPSTARGRKLRLPSPAGAAPVPRSQDAS